MSREQPLLRTQLLTWLLVPLCLLLTADTFVSYRVALNFAERAYDRSLNEIAREVSLHVHAVGGRLEMDMPAAARKVLFTDPSDKIFFEIATVDGKVMAGEPIMPAPSAGASRAQEVLYDGVVEDLPVRIVELRVDMDGVPAQPAATVRVAETKVKRNELAREILLSVLAPQVLLILIAGILVWGGVVRGLSPLARLQHAVAARSHRDLSPVRVSGVPAEVRPLLQSINELLERLDHMLTLQRRFIADAAHQLKTPVAALQAQLELTLREDDPARMREASGKLHLALERLSRLVSQLLSLARNEPEATHGSTLKPLDLNALAFEAATTWVPEALKKHIDLGFEGSPENVMIEGDAVRLRELFDNLLDNAVRYSQENGRITVRVSATPSPTVAVDDDGPSIPAQERLRVFERFHRLLGSSQDGSGLGLAIAQEIARIHGAEIHLHDDLDGIGNTFSVSFPSTRAR